MQGSALTTEQEKFLVVRDIATRVIAVIPTETRHTDQVVSALKRLFGRRKVKMAYPRASEYTSIVDLAKTRKFLYLVLFGDTSCTWILSGYIDIHTCTCVYIYIFMDLYYIYI